MAGEQEMEIRQLRLKDAHDLAPLIAAYVQALKRGAPRPPDQYYAEQLLQDRTAEFLGASLGGELVAFVMFYDLPDPLSGLRAGMAEHVYVHHNHRGKGIAKALVDVLADQAENRNWSRLILGAPRHPENGRRVFEAVARPAEGFWFELKFEA